MAVARVQSASGSNGGGGTYTVALTSPTSAGNTLVVCVGGYKGVDWVDLPDIQDNLGNQYTAALDILPTNADRMSVFYLPTIPAGITQLIIRNSAASSAVIMKYSGTTSKVDVVGSAQSQTDTGGVVTWNTPALATSTSTGVIITVAVAINVSPSGFAGTGGMGLVAEVDIVAQSVSLGVCDQLNAAAGTFSPSGTVNASMQVDSCAIAFK